MICLFIWFGFWQFWLSVEAPRTHTSIFILKTFLIDIRWEEQPKIELRLISYSNKINVFTQNCFIFLFLCFLGDHMILQGQTNLNFQGFFLFVCFVFVLFFLNKVKKEDYGPHYRTLWNSIVPGVFQVHKNRWLMYINYLHKQNQSVLHMQFIQIP